MTEQNKLAEELEKLMEEPSDRATARWVNINWPQLWNALRADREPATEAVLEESELRAIASRHARDAVAPLGSNVHPGDPVVMQEKLRAEEIIFYALKEAALKGKGASQGAEGMVMEFAKAVSDLTSCIDGMRFAHGDNPMAQSILNRHANAIEKARRVALGFAAYADEQKG